MNENCDCQYCKHKVNEYFCPHCLHNFNECEAFHTYNYIQLCPKCHPKDSILTEKQKYILNTLS